MKTLPLFQLFDHRALFRGFPGSKTDGGSSTIFSAENNYPAKSIKTHKLGPKKRATPHHHQQYNLSNLNLPPNCTSHVMHNKMYFCIKIFQCLRVAVASLPPDKKKTKQKSSTDKTFALEITRKID